MPRPPSPRGPRRPGARVAGRPADEKAPSERKPRQGRTPDGRKPKVETKGDAERKPRPASKPFKGKLRAEGKSPSTASPRPADKAGPERRPHPASKPPTGGKPRPEGKPRQPRVRADGSVAGAPRESHKSGEPQRIAKLLARAGIASRREIERMIAEGRIAIDGKPVETPATILTSLKGVSVDGNPVRPAAETRLFLFHKPTGYITAERDFSGRPTIYDRLPKDLPRLMPVGRLDLNTEGLLLLTNDGEFKRQLELPATGVERTYRARVFGEVSQEQLEALSEGVEIEGVRYGSIDANMERRTGRNFWVEMRLREGKNREVRRVLEHLGLQVSRLIRLAYGPFVLGDLPVGEVGEIRQHELAEFRKSLK